MSPENESEQLKFLEEEPTRTFDLGPLIEHYEQEILNEEGE
jgi:hypothetical protein